MRYGHLLKTEDKVLDPHTTPAKYTISILFLYLGQSEKTQSKKSQIQNVECNWEQGPVVRETGRGLNMNTEESSTLPPHPTFTWI